MANQKETPKLVIAKASHVLSSPRKTNLVLKAIVGRPASLAIKQLAVLPKRAAEPIAQLLKQAVGNAVSQFQASPDSLVIYSAFATKGRTLKRAHIGGRGKTKPYERISSHLTLNLRILTPKAVKSPSVIARSDSDTAISAIEKPKTSKKAIKSTKKTK